MGSVIYSANPTDWRDLENKVARVLEEVGANTERGKELHTVRGSVVVDVVANDRTRNPPQLILCECKHWNKRVSKGVVHAFRSVMGDSGANVGYLISVSGFQAGARDAAAMSNIHLVTWAGFQAHFYDRWIASMSEVVGYLTDMIYRLTGCDDEERYYNRLAETVARTTGGDAYSQLEAIHARYVGLRFGASHLLGPRNAIERSVSMFDGEPKDVARSPRDNVDRILAQIADAYREYTAYLQEHTNGACGSVILLDDATIRGLREARPHKDDLVRIVGRPDLYIDWLRPHETWKYRASRTTFHHPTNALRDFDLFSPATVQREVIVSFDEGGRIKNLKVTDCQFAGLPST